MIDNEALFDAWAPASSPWSMWAKPTLFSRESMALARPQQAPSQTTPTTLWAPAHVRDTAIIVDINGELSVQAGAQLALRGYRPVPLFNGCSGQAMLVDVRPVIDALARESATLRSAIITPDAPPAFLLDSRRLEKNSFVMAGKFDNRWFVTPQDMPSAACLREAGIQRIIVFTKGGIAEDLSHILLRYQEAGLAILSCDPSVQYSTPVPVIIGKPPRFRRLWFRMAVLLGFHRNSTGGFGSIIPDPSSSGYGGYG